MNAAASITHWPDRLDALIAHMDSSLTQGRVMAACASTQDQARILGRGALVVAGSQTEGRGQRGNTWFGGGDAGLAFSLVLPATTRPELSREMASAIVVALGDLLPRRLRVKAPNDVLLDGRKLAGVLIEQSDGNAVIGVGINVGPIDWPQELHGQAVSLHEVGVEIDRIEVLEMIVPRLVDSWQA
ncbi:MAG: biotin--[acetyl-CoA-carboxylase] ligase [Phycisphaerales bacterium]|nr:biotin--[acetyl-CoA-carboxylase] ligase [Phycisphaerales bacterium]